MEYRKLLEKLVNDYDSIKDNPDYLFRPGFGRDRAYQKLLDDTVVAARKMLATDILNSTVYTVRVHELVGAGDLSDHIDTLYFKNKVDAEKVIGYWNCMDIPYTDDEVRTNKYRNIPNGATVIESVEWGDAGETLYNLSKIFRNRADKFWPKYPKYMPEWYKKYMRGVKND